MSQLFAQPSLILFTGFPGSLKTFVSSRVAHRLGSLWLPTSGLGRIGLQRDDSLLRNLRDIRYSRCINALQSLSLMSASVVVDGGFMGARIKREVFSTFISCPKYLVRCEADASSRLARLRIRAKDKMDVEQTSAQSIIESRGSENIDSLSEDSETPNELGCDAIIHLNTTSFQWHVEGAIDPVLQERLGFALEQAFDEYRVTDKLSGYEGLKRNFAALAPCYEETTEWRTHATLLAQLRIDLPTQNCDVLDIGSGTGLASQWYTEQGHRCIGIDLSPQMSVRAAPRLLFTTFGSALDLPFFDASFDLVLMRQMLHYTEPALALQEAFRVVRPEGSLVVAAAVAPNEEVRPIWEEFKNVTQPLRLRVFSENDLIKVIEQAGFVLSEIRRSSLIRSESFEQLDQRATAPSRGWSAFLQTMEKIFAGVAPQIEFKVSGTIYSYRQYWVTLVGKKAR